MKIDIDNYSGPLAVLLDLAKLQKVDLTNISITQLANQYIDFINSEKKIKLDLAAEYLLMATWLAYLKSKLLLPQDDEDEFKASEVAEKLKLQLKKLELIRLLSDLLLKKERLGFEVRSRGMHGGIKLLSKSEYRDSLYDLLKGYSNTLMKRNFQTMSIPKLPFCTTEQAIHILRTNIKDLNDWKLFTDFIPKRFSNTKKLKKSGIAGFFSASLELTKEGLLEIFQKNAFDNILIKEKK
jgi:segregation and condensation protein A|tara:strand:+ start:1267 stop:1983 length:717 start_codon:yes stop_codon:yes gene_type:complete